MSNLLDLSDLRDPLTFLAGARVPLTLASPMATWQRYEWISDRLLVRLCSDRAWIERDEKIDWKLYLMDLSDPDVARWCDRRIVETLWPRKDGDNTPVYEACIVIECRANGATFVMTYRESDGQSAKGRLDVEWNIPRVVANIPLARAALLRALFGVSNA